MPRGEKDLGLTLEEAQHHLFQRVTDARDFMSSEFSESWERAERYYSGECDIPKVAGRSGQVKTEARDVVRAATPNIMRILYQARKPVSYKPRNMKHGAFVEQQELYVRQLFEECGGYNVLYQAIEEAAVQCSGPIKTYWQEDVTPEYFHATTVTPELLQELDNDPTYEILSAESSKIAEETGAALYEVTGYRHHFGGQIKIEAFPIHEFFVERRAHNLEDFVHGHSRSVTIGEAVSMGLDIDKLWDLDDDDPAQNEYAGVNYERTGYYRYQDSDEGEDPTQRTFLLTECYCKLDMDGDGVPEKYVFYLGGTNFEILHHERLEEFCIDLVTLVPTRFAPIGKSVVGMAAESQDTMTSILRAVIDNAHQANNPRVAGDANQVNFEDLMNNAIGAPIRTKGDYRPNVIDVPFTGATLVPFLDWLENDSANKIGVTKAAQGLDPDALQSTTKDGVLNTIQLSQGQLELMVRHVAESALVPIFKKLLRLSVRHMDYNQILMYKDTFVPVNLSNFDPDALATPAVGLGTASPETRAQGLQFVLQEQKEILDKYGIDNPITSLSQMFNTIDDLCEAMGLPNTARYFHHVTPAVEAAIAKGQAEQQQAQMQEQQQREQAELVVEPGAAVVRTKRIEAEMQQQKLATEVALEKMRLANKMQVESAKLDLDRDRMLQDRVIKFTELANSRREQSLIAEQERNDQVI